MVQDPVAEAQELLVDTIETFEKLEVVRALARSAPRTRDALAEELLLPPLVVRETLRERRRVPRAVREDAPAIAGLADDVAGGELAQRFAHHERRQQPLLGERIHRARRRAREGTHHLEFLERLDGVDEELLSLGDGILHHLYVLKLCLGRTATRAACPPPGE